MDAVGFLVGRAEGAAKAIGELSGEAEALDARRAAIAEAQDALDRMAEGGLTEEELRSLVSMLESLGIDTTELKKKQHDAVVEEARDLLSDASIDASQLDSDYAFRMQVAMTVMSTSIETAASIRQAQHRTYMAVIENLKA